MGIAVFVVAYVGNDRRLVILRRAVYIQQRERLGVQGKRLRAVGFPSLVIQRFQGNIVICQCAFEQDFRVVALDVFLVLNLKQAGGCTVR